MASNNYGKNMYVPILKWKQGEYLALERLTASIKDSVTPLIEIPPIGWDFEKGTLAKTPDQHLSTFASRLHNKWRNRKAFVDLNLLDPTNRMASGLHPVEYIFSQTRTNGAHARPTTSLSRDSDHQNAVKTVLKIDKRGLCLRLSFGDLVKADIGLRITSLLSFHEINAEQTDLVLDLDSPEFEPLDTLAKALSIALRRIPMLDQFMTFTIASTSFPENMGKVSPGLQIVNRNEWLLFSSHIRSFLEESITIQFGDYAIAHPSLPELDMRLIKPAASLRYTIDDAWLIAKGSNVRDNGFSQYKELCKDIVDSGYFVDKDYSAGDAYIFGCSKGTESTGNLTTWRWVGTNHHITKVVTDLANSGAL